jgi:hypothetical protein
LDHHLVQIKYLQKILKYKNIHDARQRKYDIRKLKNMEFMRIYKEQVRKGITEIVSNKITRMRKQVKVGELLMKW